MAPEHRAGVRGEGVMKHFELVWLLMVAVRGLGCGGSGEGADGGGGAPAVLGVGGGGAGGDAMAPGCPTQPSWFATEVVEVSYGPGQSFGRDRMPDVVLGPPQGGGCCQGSTDVVSLGNGGTIVLGFGGNGMVDGPGADFVVFENPFEAADGVFAELAGVSVSDDGVSWVDFDCSATTEPWGSCAGSTPVYREGGDGPVDPATDGGDAFDLAEVGLARARYVRITDRADLTGAAGVFDLDAVGIVHAACP